jgi:leucyl aminopeptidase (aminopeptidase T)
MIDLAQKILKENLGVKKDEKICVVTDEDKLSIAKYFFEAASKMNNETLLALTPLRRYHNEELNSLTESLMMASDVIVGATSASITHTQARIKASRKGARTLILRGVSEDLLKKAGEVDYQELKWVTEQVADIFNKGKEGIIETSAGTLEFSLQGRKSIPLYGMALEKGTFCALPDGECAITPDEVKTNGVLLINGPVDNIGWLKEPTILEIREGKVVSVDGDRRLENIFQRDINSSVVCEIAVGTSRWASLEENLAMAKKVMGSIHIAFGDNHTIGGKIRSAIHIDAMILNSTLKVDGSPLVEDGQLLTGGHR